MVKNKILPVGCDQVIEAFARGETIYTMHPQQGWVVASRSFILRCIEYSFATGERPFCGSALYGLKG